jgi:hypothetical protein
MPPKTRNGSSNILPEKKVYPEPESISKEEMVKEFRYWTLDE